MSGDCFVMTTIVRGVVAFAWTFFIGEWVQSAGAALPFGIFGMRKNEIVSQKKKAYVRTVLTLFIVMAIFGLLAVPILLYGKRFRIATAKFLPEYGRAQ